MLHYALSALVGVSLGAGAASVSLVSANRRVRAFTFLLLVAAALPGGAIATQTVSDGIAALLGLLAGAGVVAILATRGYGPQPFIDEALSDSEANRAKRRDDVLVLLVGAEGSGKSTLVDAIVRHVEAGLPSGLKLARQPRSWEGHGTRLTELVLENGYGTRNFRFWESRSLPSHRSGALAPLSDFDVVVLVIDPTRHSGVAEGFPDGMSPPDQRRDANRLILSLVEAVPSSEHAPIVIAALTKCDLLRFAITPALLALPIAVGPGWHEQFSHMLPPDRWALLDALGLKQARERTARFDWGQGSPIFTFAMESSTFESFGHRELFSAISNASFSEIRTSP